MLAVPLQSVVLRPASGGSSAECVGCGVPASGRGAVRKCRVCLARGPRRSHRRVRRRTGDNGPVPARHDRPHRRTLDIEVSGRHGGRDRRHGPVPGPARASGRPSNPRAQVAARPGGQVDVRRMLHRVPVGLAKCDAHGPDPDLVDCGNGYQRTPALGTQHRRSAPPARSTARTPAASTSRSRTAGSSTRRRRARRTRSPTGYICAKVRQLRRAPLRPGAPAAPGCAASGRKGEADSAAHLGRGARPRRRAHASRRATRCGGEAILPYYYGGSNGLLTAGHHRRAALPPARRLAPRAHRLRGGDRRAAARALRQDAGGRPSRLRARAPDRGLGTQPVARPGIHLVPLIQAAQKPARGSSSSIRAGRRSPSRPTCTSPLRPGTDLAVALCRSSASCSRTAAPTASSSRAHATGAEELARARRAVDASSAPPQVAGIVPAADLERFAGLYAATRPAVIRCGWGLERNRNGGSARRGGARAAGGRRQVRRARRRLHDVATRRRGQIERRALGGRGAAPTRIDQHEPARARRCRCRRAAGRGALRLQLQPARDRARPGRGAARASRARTSSPSSSTR